tara:strand:+ start:58751 stop:60037 length:1287 start_codon:yes stop_codon:yes gene_type:complete
MKYIFIILAVVFTNTAFTQDNHNHQNHSNSVIETEYTCPMHPEFITTNKDAECPKCGMNLVKKEKQEKQIDNTTYVCPMHPQIKNSEPSECPICGMDLVPEKKEESANADSSITIKPETQQNIGVTFTKVKKGTLWQIINTYGKIESNQNKEVNYNLYVDGWIKNITEKRNGELVKKGDYLFSLFSPELIDAQYNFLLAFEGNSNQPFLKKADQKLKYLGLNQKTIDKIKNEKKIIENIPFYALEDGILHNFNIRKGQKVQQNSTLFSTFSNKSTWVNIFVPENKGNWITNNTAFSLEYNNKKYNSKIDIILPKIENNSIVARGTLGQFLPINSTVDITLYGQPINNAIYVPVESLLLSKNKNRVIIKNNNQFVQRNVEVGKIINNKAQIIKGLKEGEIVVTSSQFLIDSEATLSSGFSNISGDHNHD